MLVEKKFKDKVVGWYCQKCKALIENKMKRKYIITCDCYDIAGSHICLERVHSWYNYIKRVQKKHWVRTYIKQRRRVWKQYYTS